MSLASSFLEPNSDNVVAPVNRILLIDDDEFICTASALHIKQMASKFTNKPIDVKPVFTLAAGIAAVSAPDYDLVFLDLKLRGESDGIETLERFQQANCHNVPVAIFTASSPEDGDYALETLRKCYDKGVKGILLKSGNLVTMFRGLERILFDPEFWAPEPVIRALMSTQRGLAESDDRLGLTPGEWKIAEYISRGSPTKEIARELDRSDGHIRNVTKQIFHKVKVRNRTELALRIEKLKK
jgi:two-component system nitrate/nitrite response regulator NarL